MSDSQMREFWDNRAAEDPYYFVDNRQTYGRPDEVAFWRGGEEDLARLLAAVGVELAPSDDVVEIGCGIGRLTRAIAPRARTVRALDVSPRMLDLARTLSASTLPNVAWVLGDGVSLAGIDDASASVVISHVVFQHIPDPVVTLGYIREIARVLRPAGWALFQISNDPRIHRPTAPQRLLASLRTAFLRGPQGQDHPAWLGSSLELPDVERVAAAAGASVRRVAGAGTAMCAVLLVR